MKKMKREDMRKVTFNSDVYPEHGYFHEWSSSWEEVGNGVGQFPVGIIERPSGKIEVVFAQAIRFETRSDSELADNGELENWL